MRKIEFPLLRGFLFDLDGTLIDSKLDLVNSVNFMLQEMGRDALPLETVASYIGHGAPRLVADALGMESSEADRQRGVTIFLEHYEKHSLDATHLYPGVRAGLEALREYPMAVLTNKPRKMSVEILQALGLGQFFRVVYGGDSFASKKPDPTGAQAILQDLQIRPAEAAMIGDSDVDIQTARNAGTLAIGVNYGFGQHDPEAHPADCNVDTLEELTAMVLRTR
jgi:phosphoglycolate phosphatase